MCEKHCIDSVVVYVADTGNPGFVMIYPDVLSLKCVHFYKTVPAE